MNKIKILISALLMGFVFTSCDTNDEPTGYDPANYNYTLPSTFKLNVESVSDRSFEFSYTPTTAGKGYYMVLPAGAKAPTSTQVHAGGAGLQSGKFNVDGKTPVLVKVDKTIYGGYAYDIYAINKSTDNFISETVAKITATTVEGDTPDAEPKIVSITPSFQSANQEFMGQSVTFTFSEPVKLVNNASFNIRMALNGGPGIINNFDIVSPASTLGGTVIEGYATEITISGWNSIPNAFTIVNFAEGTFVDKAGKLVPAISGFDYYFRAKAGTPSEIATLLVGDWDYTITNNALNSAVLSGTRGTWSITKGTKEGTIILSNQVDHDINAFLSWDDSATREFEVTVGVPDQTGKGRLYMAPHKSGAEKSIYSDGTDLYWTCYYEDVVSPVDPDLTGQYDLANKTIHFRLDLGSRLGYVPFNAHYLGDIQYDYTYVAGTGDLGKPGRAVKTSKVFVGENSMLPAKSTPTKEYLMSLPAKAKGKYVGVLK